MSHSNINQSTKSSLHMTLKLLWCWSCRNSIKNSSHHALFQCWKYNL